MDLRHTLGRVDADLFGILRKAGGAAVADAELCDKGIGTLRVRIHRLRAKVAGKWRVKRVRGLGYSMRRVR